MLRLSDIVVWTEGKTDRQHLLAAHRALDIKYSISFGQIEDRKRGAGSGQEALLSQCRALARLPQACPNVFIFDRDTDAVLREVQCEGALYKSLGNNVYSMALPVPSHRNEEQGVCIELYYTDCELSTKDQSGRRLFLSSEFNSRSGKHLHDPSINVGRVWKLPDANQRRIKIIDAEVYDASHNNIALPKADFAALVSSKEGVFGTFGFSAYIPLFNVLREIISTSNARSWDSFAEKAISTSAIYIRTASTRRLDSPGRKPTMSSNVVRLSVGDRIWIDLDIRALSTATNVGPLGHILVLVTDVAEAICLCPHDVLAPNSRITESRLQIPDPHYHPGGLEIYDPRGLHTIYCFLSVEPLAPEVYNFLRGALSRKKLDDLANVLSSLAVDMCCLMKREFYVE